MFNLEGFLAGLAAFFIIGLFHPVVIKLEYYYGKRFWWLLFLPGVFFALFSLWLSGLYSIMSGCIGFALFWSTAEIFMQHRRVLKGQAKKNPKREYK